MAGDAPLPLIGVFALQGDFAQHLLAWRAAGAVAREVRGPRDLDGLDALSLPGGESTTMLRLLEVTGFRAAFAAALERLPVFATCAGAILMGTEAERLPAAPFGLVDVAVARNAYGRQVDSFEATLDAPGLGPGASYPGVFIRAPRFLRIGPGVEVIARHGGEAVALRQGRRALFAFHPELTDDLRFHRWFLEAIVAPHAAERAQAARSAGAAGRAS